jgi:transcriptional regulator with GAF, ATPase, and Fis domain
MHNYFPDRSANGAVVGISCVVADVTVARQSLKRAQAKIEQLRNQLRAENTYLQEEIKSNHNFEEIIGDSASMMVALGKVEMVAAIDTTVLLLGETGSGKELFARAIHAHSNRSKHPLIKVDCTTLPPGLVESELFGHTKGAFTGADASKVGRFELAHGGTVFLDEIGELPLDLQSKLLRVLQDGEFSRVGSTRVQQTDVRIIAATNRDLKSEMEAGRFRKDLYYRICVFPIGIPPLRDRLDDIPLLASFFVTQLRRKLGKKIDQISSSMINALRAYDWPGNVRELQNIVERALITSTGRELLLAEPLGNTQPPSCDTAQPLKRDLRTIERQRILTALATSGWKIKGDRNAANLLGLKPSTLRTRMKILGIQRPRWTQQSA